MSASCCKARLLARCKRQQKHRHSLATGVKDDNRANAIKKEKTDIKKSKNKIQEIRNIAMGKDGEIDT